MYLVSETIVEQIVSLDLAREAARRAFIGARRGDSRNFPVLAASGPHEGTAVNVKFGYDARSLGMKIGTFWPGNACQGLANHGATTFLLDPKTGHPLALIAASLLNRYRTAGADAVATDALARRDATILAIVGAGRQSEFDARAIAKVRPLREIRIGARRNSAAEALARRLREIDVPIRCCSIEKAVDGAHMISCVTNAVTPVLESGWVGEGTHISAMGADRVGKQELPLALIERASIFADDPGQAVRLGECQHAAAAGALREDDIIAIGAVLGGEAAGRERDREITIFDSSGLASQDLVIAADVLRLAIDAGIAQVLTV